MSGLYFTLMDKRIDDNHNIPDPKSFRRELVYGALEATLDANHHKPFLTRRETKTIRSAQRRIAVQLWLSGNDSFTPWVPWWRKALRRAKEEST